MKLETTEQELSLLKNDINNMRGSISSLNNNIVDEFKVIKKQLDDLHKYLEIRPRHKITCQGCDGHGTIYISPISDCGQSNKCMGCMGEGILWV